MNDQRRFRGSYTVAVTPFTDGGSAIDLGALEDYIHWQLEVGVPGIIALGTTGEFLTISEEERQSIVETYVETVDGRIPVVVGTMNAYTPIAVRNSRQAEALGADGLMILPPYYYTPTDDEILRYYEAISEAVDVPIMLYNNPVTSNVDMSAQLVGKLAKSFANIQYIKESSQDLARVRDVIDEAEGAIEVFAGERLVDSYLLGAIGYVNPFGNYIPRASSRIFDLLEAGRIDDARKIGHHMHRIDVIIAEGHPTYGHQCYSKALAAAAGHPVGDVRPPITRFDQLGAEGIERVEKIRAIMEELDELVDSLGLP